MTGGHSIRHDAAQSAASKALAEIYLQARIQEHCLTEITWHDVDKAPPATEDVRMRPWVAGRFGAPQIKQADGYVPLTGRD
jgi:hypothetical protein